MSQIFYLGMIGVHKHLRMKGIQNYLVPLEIFNSTSNISVILNIEIKGRILETHMGT